MDKRVFIAKQDNPRVASVVQFAQDEIAARMRHGQDFEIEVREPRRTMDANACMWATLSDIANQVHWPHTVRGQWVIDRMTAESWKAVLTAAFEQETAMAQSINGGTVMLGAKTSQYSRRKMGEFIEFVHAFGAEKGVKWSVRARGEYEQFHAPR